MAGSPYDYLNQKIIDEPRLEIIEQPRSRGYRFRYECEGGSHGNITGENSKKGNRTFPTVRLINWPGHARISVQCVTDEDKPKPHTHELIGKNCKNGICVVEVQPTDSRDVQFDGLSIKHSTRKRAIEILTMRIQEAILQEKKQNNLRFGHTIDELTEEEKQHAREKAKKICPELDLSVVRLLFKAQLISAPEGPVIKTLGVYSEPIYDAKSPGAAALRICRMDKSSGSCVGDEEVFLLCDRVQKDDICVSFQEFDKDGVLRWEGHGKFGPQDVHRQFAIVFRTPPYRTTQITSPVEVKVKLKRLNKPEESNGMSFTYYPEQKDEDQLIIKRKKKLHHQLIDTKREQGKVNTSTNSNGMMQEFKADNCVSSVCSEQSVYHFGSGNHVLTPSAFGAGGQDNAGMFPQHKTLSKMVPVQMIPNSQASSPATSYVSSPKKSPSPQSICDQSIEIYPTIDYDMSMYDLGSLYQGRGISNEKVQPVICATPSNVPHEPLRMEAVQPIDLSKPHPLDLSKSKLESDSGNSDFEFTLKDDVIMNSVKPSKVELPLKDQVIQFGDRLFGALLEYAQTGDVTNILMVLRYLMIQQDENGDTIIHLAIIHEKAYVLNKFLKVVATLPDQNIINKTNDVLQTPLHLAAILRNAPAVEALLEYDASITTVDRCGNTPIHLAVMHKAPQCLSLMLTHIIEKNKGRSPVVDKLNYKGLAPLHIAVQNGHLDCVKTLTRIGRANVNVADGCSGRTPLHYAVELDLLSIVGFLISQPKIDVNAPDFTGFTPLHFAVQLRCHACAALLLAAGADPTDEIIEQVPDSEDDISDVNSEEEELEKQHERNIESDGSKEEDEKDKESSRVVIKTAWTLAKGDEQMERILRGEECTDIGTTFESVKIAENLQDYNNMYTSSSKLEFGVSDLDITVKKKLAQLLDPASCDHDWKALAKKLHMSPSLIEVFEYMDSPTRALLDNYEATEGSVEQLRSALIEMEQSEAVMLIDESKKHKEMAKTVLGDSIYMSSSTGQIESGIGSLSL